MKTKMARYPQQQTRAQYQKLPQVLKEAIFSEEIAEKMYEIGRRNGLNIEKTGFLAEEAGYIVLGLTRPREFVGQLVERLEVTTDKAKEIAQHVNHEIFFPLHEALKQAHGVDVKEETIEKAEPLAYRTAPPSPKATSGEAPQKQEPQPTRQPAPPQSSQTRPQQPKEGETIDLRQQYRPKMPEGTPPSKIPPINLRAQRDEPAKPSMTPQGGAIPEKGVTFPQQKHEQTRTDRTDVHEQREQVQAGENVKTSPFGISSGRLIEDLEKKMQLPPPEPPPAPSKETLAEKTISETRPSQGTPAFTKVSAGKEEAPKPSEPIKPLTSAPPNIPLKEEETRTDTDRKVTPADMNRNATKSDPGGYTAKDPYREPIE